MSGPIETTQCDYETLESINDDLHQNLHELVRTPFFKYLKVCRFVCIHQLDISLMPPKRQIDLSRECPYWEANGYCILRDCAVTTVDEVRLPISLTFVAVVTLTIAPNQTDIPEAWRTECLSKLNRPHTDELRKTLPGCYYRDSDFCVLDDDESKG